MKKDDATTIQELKDIVEKFVAERNWGEHHTAKNLAISISVEAAELLEHYQWDRYKDDEAEEKQAIADELGDILAYIFHFAITTDIDLSTAFQEKLAKAAKKYPVELFNANRAGKDSADYFKIKKAYRQNNQNKKTDGPAK
jgi:dCTP diphosphatase